MRQFTMIGVVLATMFALGAVDRGTAQALDGRVLRPLQDAAGGGQRSLPGDGRRRTEGAVVVEFPIATVTVPRRCADGGEYEVRYKVDRSGLRRGTLHNDLEATETYMGLIRQAISQVAASRIRSDCGRANIRVVAMNGTELLRDTLRTMGGELISDRSLAEQQIAAAAPTTSSTSYTTEDLDNNDRKIAALKRIANRRAVECRRATAADCAASAKADVQRAYDDLVVGVRQYAANQPISYDGIRSLNEVRSTFRIWSTFKHARDPLADQTYQLILGVVDARTGTIEAKLRPQILADLSKPGGSVLIDDLFLGDTVRLDYYRSRLKGVAQIRADAAFQKRLNTPGPPNIKIRQALVQSFARAPTWAIANNMGMVSLTEQSLAVVALGTGYIYSFDVNNVSCAALPSIGKRCAYRFRFNISALILGAETPAISSDWIDRKDDFTEVNFALRSSKLDQMMARAAESANSVRGSAAASGPTAQDRADKSRQQMNDWLCVGKSDPCGL